MRPLPLQRLLMLQMAYANAGVMDNVGSLVAVRNDQGSRAAAIVINGFGLLLNLAAGAGWFSRPASSNGGGVR